MEDFLKISFKNIFKKTFLEKNPKAFYIAAYFI